MYSHDKQNYAILPEAVKFRDEFRSFRNNFVNECGDSSCVGGTCDNSGKTGFDWLSIKIIIDILCLKVLHIFLKN